MWKKQSEVWMIKINKAETNTVKHTPYPTQNTHTPDIEFAFSTCCSLFLFFFFLCRRREQGTPHFFFSIYIFSHSYWILLRSPMNPLLEYSLCFSYSFPFNLLFSLYLWCNSTSSYQLPSSWTAEVWLRAFLDSPVIIQRGKGVSDSTAFSTRVWWLKTLYILYINAVPIA